MLYCSFPKKEFVLLLSYESQRDKMINIMKTIKFQSSLIAGIFVLTFNIFAIAGTETEVLAETSGVATSFIKVPSGYGTDHILDTTRIFTDRDLKQKVDFSKAVKLELKSRTQVVVQKEGIYILSGVFTDTSVIVEADDDAKIQFILDNLKVSNKSMPAIYVKSADKVYITTTDSKNSLQVTESYAKDGDTNLDAVIFSRSDLILNGTGTIEIVSATGGGISSKDDLKITGGTLMITASTNGLSANDSIIVFDGNIDVKSTRDALHSENKDDPLSGYIYIRNGVLNITTGDDAIRGNSVVQIDGGKIKIATCREGIEATFVQINGGTLVIYALDDGINAAYKTQMTRAIIVNGGNIDVSVASGDTDAFDSNGYLYINGGTINVQAWSAFDSSGQTSWLGGDITVNGKAMTRN